MNSIKRAPQSTHEMRRLTLKFRIKSEGQVPSQTSRLTLRFEFELEGPTNFHRYFGRAFYTTVMVSHYR